MQFIDMISGSAVQSYSFQTVLLSFETTNVKTPSAALKLIQTIFDGNQKKFDNYME